MARPRSPKAGSVQLVKLFLKDDLKTLATQHAGGPMKLTKWAAGVVDAFLSDPGLRYTRDPGTGPETLSMELPSELVNRIRRADRKISATIRQAFLAATLPEKKT